MRKRRILLVVAIAAAGLAVPAQAWAEPSGCAHSYPEFYVTNASGRSQMHANSSGNCNTFVTRTFRVEIKHDISFQPDPVVSHAEDYGDNLYYYAATSTCDKGNSATYYGRSFFIESATYHDSSHMHVEAC
jgi:hypothetical protein